MHLGHRHTPPPPPSPASSDMHAAAAPVWALCALIVACCWRCRCVRAREGSIRLPSHPLERLSAASKARVPLVQASVAV